MQSLVDKIQAVGRQVVGEKGLFTFFGMFLRENSDKWDILAAAPWIDKDEGAGLRYLSEIIVAKLSARELLDIAGIVTFKSTHPDIKSFNKFMRFDGDFNLNAGAIRIGSRNIFGLDITQAIVFGGSMPQVAHPIAASA